MSVQGAERRVKSVAISGLRSSNINSINTGFDGIPKTMVVGGTKRAYVSSQSSNRAILESEYFMPFRKDEYYDVRTREMPNMIVDRMIEQKDADKDDPNIELVRSALCTIGKKDSTKSKHEGKGITNQVLLLTGYELDNLYKAAKKLLEYLRTEEWESKKQEAVSDKKKEEDKKAAVTAACGKQLRKICNDIGFKKEKIVTPRAALQGRFSTDELIEGSESALRSNMSYTINEVPRIYRDVFTAVDERSMGNGAGMLDTKAQTGGVYWIQYDINVDELADLVSGYGEGSVGLAQDIANCFTEGAAKVVPTAHSHLLYTQAYCTFFAVELMYRNNHDTYETAFTKAVKDNGNGLMEAGEARLVKWMDRLRKDTPAIERYIVVLNEDDLDAETKDTLNRWREDKSFHIFDSYADMLSALPDYMFWGRED